MRYEWIDEYLMGKPGVTKDLQESWNWRRYHIGGKMFTAICLDGENKPYYINLKLEPAEGRAIGPSTRGTLSRGTIPISSTGTP